MKREILEQRLAEATAGFVKVAGRMPDSISLSYEALSVMTGDCDVSLIILGKAKVTFEDVRLFWSPELDGGTFVLNAIHPTAGKILAVTTEYDCFASLINIHRITKNVIEAGGIGVKEAFEEIKEISSRYDAWVER